METTDKTFLEMQQQMQQLRDMLENQKIVNERILRRSCGRTIDRLRIKSSAPIVAGIAGLALIPLLGHLGFSLLLMIFSLNISMLVCRLVLPGTTLGLKPCSSIQPSKLREHCTGT